MRTELGYIMFSPEQLVPSDNYRKGYERTNWKKEITLEGKVRRLGTNRVIITVKNN